MNKKIIAALALLLIFVSCAVTSTAFAAGCEQHIAEIATAHDKVVEAQCIVYNRACLLAIKTEKFSTKSEYDKFKEELTAQIENDCEVDSVFITRSPKIMHQLAQINKLSDGERQKAIEDLIEHELNRRDNGERKPIQPRWL